MYAEISAQIGLVAKNDYDEGPRALDLNVTRKENQFPIAGPFVEGLDLGHVVWQSGKHLVDFDRVTWQHRLLGAESP